MSKISTKIITIFIIFSYLSLVLSPLISGEEVLNEEKELYLLRGEHHLFVNATENVSSFHIRYVFPPDYGYQCPVLFEILNDTTANLSNYQIEDDTNEPNKIIKFTIESMQKDESVLIHFNCWVLVTNHDFSDRPDYIKFPRRLKLPDEVKIFLKSSEVIQSRRVMINLKARQLKGFRNDVDRFAKRSASFIKHHRYFLWTNW